MRQGGFSKTGADKAFANSCEECAIGAPKGAERKWCQGAPGTAKDDLLENDCIWSWNRKSPTSQCVDQPGARMSDPPPVYFVYKRTGIQ